MELTTCHRAKPILASLVAVAACTDVVDDPAPELSTTSSNLIGSTNAVSFNVSGSSISRVMGANWGSDWSHVVPLTVGGKQLLFLYSRELGTAKVVALASNGDATTLTSSDSFQRGWDEVVASKTPASSKFNLLFYRRSDNTLKGLNIAADGSITTGFSQPIDPPSTFGGRMQGWDYMAGAKMSSAGELVLYSRLAGEALILRWTQSLNGFTIINHPTNWQTVWDQMAAGDMTGDGVDDLVLYSAQTGTLKVVTFNSLGATTGSIPFPNAEVSAGSQLAVADFGGGTHKDILLYNVDGSPDFSSGRLRIWTDRSDGTYTVQVNDTDVQDGWTNVVPVSVGATHQGIFFYSSQRVIKARIYPVSGSPFAHPDFEFTTHDGLEATRQLYGMRKAYAAAGIAFDLNFGPLWIDVFAGTLDCNDGTASEFSQASLAAFVTIPHDTLPILLPLDSPGGAAGCSEPDYTFVKSAYPVYHSGTDTTIDKHYAHEIGHYFGLRHANIPGGDPDGTAAVLGLTGTLLDLDTDATADGQWPAVEDSPVAIDRDWWAAVDPNKDPNHALECNAGATQHVDGLGGHGVDLVVQPYSVMAYDNCPGNLGAQPGQGVYSLSREEQQLVRHMLYTQRKALIGM